MICRLVYLACRTSAARAYIAIMAIRTHAGVDSYLDNLPEWQRDICRDLREIIHDADPEIEETIKRTVQPYFVLQGNVCALLATKDHVNLFLYDPTVPIRPGSSTRVTATPPGEPSRSTRTTRSTVRR